MKTLTSGVELAEMMQEAAEQDTFPDLIYFKSDAIYFEEPGDYSIFSSILSESKGCIWGYGKNMRLGQIAFIRIKECDSSDVGETLVFHIIQAP